MSIRAEEWNTRWEISLKAACQQYIEQPFLFVFGMMQYLCAVVQHAGMSDPAEAV
jgi:hypothetical protein